MKNVSETSKAIAMETCGMYVSDMGLVSDGATGRAFQKLGQYELFEQIGRGGMGLVFKGRHAATDRIVAVKVIDPDRLRGLPPDDQYILKQRFLTEARSAAAVKHENVLPVYDAGDESGVAFLAMHLVDGGTLADRLKTTQVIEALEAARIFKAVASGLAAVHNGGMIHRDISPRNILLDGRDGVYLGDFGLVKNLQSDTALTQEHAIVGTLPYMSPEQISGSGLLTQASDIYSLGASLYQALAAVPPFIAPTQAELIRTIDRADPKPLTVYQFVPSDLNAICMKCLAKEPHNRYANANELREDLQRFLDGKPTFARPLSQIGKAGKWIRRNPLVAGLFSTAALLLTLLLFGAMAGWYYTNGINKDLVVSLERESEARETLRRIFDQYFLENQQDRHSGVLRNSPGVLNLRQRLAEEAVSYYAKRDKQLNTVDSCVDLAESCLELAAIQKQQGALEGATETLGRALEPLLELDKTYPDDPGLLYHAGSILSARGQIYVNSGQSELAIPDYQKCDRLLKQLMELNPADMTYVYGRVVQNIALAGIYRNSGDLKQAELILLNAANAGEKVLAADPEGRRTWPAVAGAHDELAGVYALQGNFEHAETSSRTAIELVEDWLAFQSDNLHLIHLKVFFQSNLANILYESGKPSQALHEVNQAMESQTRLSAEAPNDVQMKLDLSASQHLRARIFQTQGRCQAAIDEVLSAIQLVAEIIQLNSDHLNTRVRDIELRIMAGQLKLGQGQLRDARSHLESAIDLGGNPVVDPENPVYVENRAKATMLLSAVVDKAGDHDSSIEFLRQSSLIADGLNSNGRIQPSHLLTYVNVKLKHAQFVLGQTESNLPEAVDLLESLLVHRDGFAGGGQTGSLLSQTFEEIETLRKDLSDKLGR